MRSHVSLPNIAAVASGAVLGALLLSGAANAITDTVFRYSTPKTGYLGIPTAAFTPRESVYTYSNTGASLYPAAAGQACFVAPVSLPQGAKMTALAIWYERPNGGDEVDIALSRVKPSDVSTGLILSKQPAVTPALRGVSYPITNASLQTIDNVHYLYYLAVCLNGMNSAAIGGARLTYQYSTAGD